MPFLEFEIWCECGLLLEATDTRGGFAVEPCGKCLDAAHADGKTEGYDQRDEEG